MRDASHIDRKVLENMILSGWWTQKVIFVIISIMELELDHFKETTVVQLCMLFMILKISLNMRWEEHPAHTLSHQ